jgi:hypothetical protein
MKIVILTSGLPRIFITPLMMMAGQLQLKKITNVSLLGLFWRDLTTIELEFLKILSDDCRVFIEPPRDFSSIRFERTRPEVIASNTLSMHLGRKLLLDKLVKIKVQIDTSETIYIYLRTDICLTRALNLNDFVNDILMYDSLYIPSGGCWANGWNDQFAIGKYNAISNYLNMYDSIIRYYEKDRIMFHPETLLKHHLKSNHIQVKPLPCSSLIFRGEYEVIEQPGIIGWDAFSST